MRCCLATGMERRILTRPQDGNGVSKDGSPTGWNGTHDVGAEWNDLGLSLVEKKINTIINPRGG